MLHSRAYRLLGSACATSFLAILPPFLVGFEKKIPFELSEFFYTSERMDEMNL